MHSYDPALDLREYNYPLLEFISDDLVRKYFSLLGGVSSYYSLPVLWSSKDDNTDFQDLSRIGNLLVVGPPGIGKSNFLHQLILSLLFTKHPSQLKFVLIDLKKIEFGLYERIEKHFLAKISNGEASSISNAHNALHTLNSLCIEADNRYDLLKEAGARNIKEYNEQFVAHKLDPQKGHQFLPFLVLFIDELADVLIFDKNGVNSAIEKLLRIGNKVGILNIIATSQIIGDTLSSNLKILIDQRVVFRLFDKEDYRKFFGTVNLDMPNEVGDFLYKFNGNFIKGQSFYFNLNNIETTVNFISEQRGYPQAFLLPEYVDEKEMEAKGFDVNDKDPLFEDAAKLIVASQMGSTSLLQRRMKLGYNRAGRLMDQLEAAGVVGMNQGSKARDVLIKTEADLQQLLNSV